ncbi:MAG: SAM-dependent methyltransferase [Anaerofustis stercorihominis]|nr:SAM-dependent methyltransferase [Anaerofustis stercorihominis]
MYKEYMAICKSSTSKAPNEIMQQLMKVSSCPMHGPVHHVLVGSALITAYKNAGGDIDLESALEEMIARGSKVPGGVCGNWGSCGAAISSGMFMSIITGATPTTNESWGLSNLMTSGSLANIGAIGGPRCCKRNATLAINSAIDFVAEHLGVHMEKTEIHCEFTGKNSQCIGERCPFNK